MKRQIPLKWKLTGSTLGIWVIIIIVFIAVYNSSQSKIDTRYSSLFAEEVLAKGLLVSNDLTFEIAAAQAESAVGKLKTYTNTSPDIELIAVLAPSKKPLYLSNKHREADVLLKAATEIKPGETKIVDERLIGVQAIYPDEGELIGYTVIVKSLHSYLSLRRWLTTVLILVSVLGTLIAAGAAYFIGHRIASPIHNLVFTAERITNGDLTHIEINTEGSHEMTRLAATIQLMAEAMRSQVMAIKNLTAEIAEISKDTE
jgi:methyl-accepting chemotaxis protein